MVQTMSRAPDETLTCGYQLMKFLYKYSTDDLFFSKEFPIFIDSKILKISPIFENLDDPNFVSNRSRSQ